MNRVSLLAPRVVVVCPNPAVDRLQVVSSLQVGAVNRATEVVVRPGGKGMFVAGGLRRLGSDVVIHGFLGAAGGETIREGCARDGITDHHVIVRGATRVTTVVAESDTGRSTVITEPGPRIDTDDTERLLSILDCDLQPDDVLVTTGSLPPGAGTDLHARVIDVASRRGCRSVADSHGDALREAVAAGPWMVKTNLEELAELVDAELSDQDVPGVLAAMDEIRRRGVKHVIVTLGAHGAVHLSDGDATSVPSPTVEARNPTGSGDMTLAGITHGLLRGRGPVAALQLGVAAGACNAERLEPAISADRVKDLERTVVTRRLDFPEARG